MNIKYPVILLMTCTLTSAQPPWLNVLVGLHLRTLGYGYTGGDVKIWRMMDEGKKDELMVIEL